MCWVQANLLNIGYVVILAVVAILGAAGLAVGLALQGTLASLAACITMHRFKLLRSNRQIPQNYQKLKWHFLPLIRMSICGERQIALTDKK